MFFISPSFEQPPFALGQYLEAGSSIMELLFLFHFQFQFPLENRDDRMYNTRVHGIKDFFGFQTRFGTDFYTNMMMIYEKGSL